MTKFDKAKQNNTKKKITIKLKNKDFECVYI